MGNTYKDMCQTEEAISCYKTAIRVRLYPSASFRFPPTLSQPKFTAYLINCCTEDINGSDPSRNFLHLSAPFSFPQFILSFILSYQIKPDNAVALANLAAAYKDSGQLLEAIRYYQVR